MREHPFKSNEELDKYFDDDKLQCLICGKRFHNLTLHLQKYHHMSGDDYRDVWAIPRSRGLVGRQLHIKLSEESISRWESGVNTSDHLAEASKRINYSDRVDKVPASKINQVEAVVEAAPWRRNQLPPKARRANGRDAKKCREYQRAYRAKKAGDDTLMIKYRKKYSIGQGK